jgi:carboxyl-terminal processing protease
MVIQQQNDNNGKSKVYVVTPYEDTPSFRAGIHPGDMIARSTANPPTAGRPTRWRRRSRAPRDARQVTMVRYGQAKPLVFDLVRDEIPHPSIDLKYEIRPGIGYIHLTQFQETTGDEMEEAIDGFGNLKGLVLDLRENPAAC